jgi:hypothetical protein
MAGILINNQSIKQSIAHNLSALCLLSASAIQQWFLERYVPTAATTLVCHLKSVKRWVGTKHLMFCLLLCEGYEKILG